MSYDTDNKPAEDSVLTGKPSPDGDGHAKPAHGTGTPHPQAPPADDGCHAVKVNILKGLQVFFVVLGIALVAIEFAATMLDVTALLVFKGYSQCAVLCLLLSTASSIALEYVGGGDWEKQQIAEWAVLLAAIALVLVAGMGMFR